jgi:hypothetical protein
VAESQVSPEAAAAALWLNANEDRWPIIQVVAMARGAAASGFLAGVRWERQRVTQAVEAGTEQEDTETRRWVQELVKP